ncbi:uncharacterized protein V6R79_013580 [Siganus canaliculatus]
MSFIAMSSRKRKRYSKDIKSLFFPDDVKNVCLKPERESSSLSSSSTARSWEKCGDSFLDTPLLKSLKSSGRKLSAIRRLAPSSALAQFGSVSCKDDVSNITWSSSDSEESEDETQELQEQQQHHPQRAARLSAPIQGYSRALHMLRTDKDELPVIETDSDQEEEGVEEPEKDSGQQISDCESEPLDEKPEKSPLNPREVAELEISGYVSGGEDIGQSVTSSLLNCESFSLPTGEGSKRSVSDWVRSAQSMLRTPQKSLDKQSKTPEDSAKKRRKFQSGGLAERLSRLQGRQRSAVSFWRHQSTSNGAAAAVDRPGVLVLEVLEVQEECSMQLVRCKQHQPPGEGHQHSEPASTLVLFNKETASQLIAAQGDMVHIYPPWQSLSVEGFSFDVILNTHFSQKVDSASKPANMSPHRGLLSAEKCRPYSLCKTFGLLEECKTSEENSAQQDAALNALYGGLGVLTRHCASLLEAIEGLGQPGSMGQDVEVVVQRVYSIPVPDCSPVSFLKPRVPFRSPSAPPPPGKGKTRLCVLVQDSYGMFSEVQLHLLPCQDELHRYSHMWQGRTCVLRGIKVVQRVTRERRSRLFSLIDSLWPPVIPLGDHGNTPSVSSERRPPGPAPSFCYLLSGQENSVEPAEGLNMSPLYLPPIKRTLRDILQSERKSCRCSFVATVIFKRITKSSDVGHGEVWLVLTDPSLQEKQPERPCSRTVALCVYTSCVLTSSVLEALNSPAACRMSFRDAIQEHGVFLCVEHSVVEMCTEDSEGNFESLSQSLQKPEGKTLPQPVRLDPLSPEVTPNSLCSLTGVIVGVDENTAFSWPACNHCGSDDLAKLAELPENFNCVSCKSVVDKPDTRIQLEVFLSSALSDCTLKVKLQQKTIMTILNTAALASNEFAGYDVDNVLGKEVGPITVYVRAVTRKPALWIGLEEVFL